MHRYPYITPYVNETFGRERTRWDFVVLRPVLLVLYFLLRFVSFPIKFLVHRRPFGFESRAIDTCMAFGMKYLARRDAAELFLRHVQIEPLLYRHILSTGGDAAVDPGRKLNGIDGDFGIGDVATLLVSDTTVGHDRLSYEVVDRFDKERFVENLDRLRATVPGDHGVWDKAILAENEEYSWQLLGPTNVVILIVTAITVFGDLHTTVTALNSFGSDSLLLWCLKRIYARDPEVLIDLDFFMQEVANRGHYNSSAFFSNPSQYLYYHIVFDEVAYELLRNVRPTPGPAVEGTG
ncbi:MAG: hypothetical protein AAF532_03290 [Planctomycetota bacterium]